MEILPLQVNRYQLSYILTRFEFPASFPLKPNLDLISILRMIINILMKSFMV